MAGREKERLRVKPSFQTTCVGLWRQGRTFKDSVQGVPQLQPGKNTSMKLPVTSLRGSGGHCVRNRA